MYVPCKFVSNSDSMMTFPRINRDKILDPKSIAELSKNIEEGVLTTYFPGTAA
jgi:hypothetical protein